MQPSLSNAVLQSAPIRTVAIDFQGLTGSPVIALAGGSSMIPLPDAKGEAPLLIADIGQAKACRRPHVTHFAASTVSWQRTRSRCATPFANLDTFSAALARNSERLDGIVAGLERMTGGAAAKARVVSYSISACLRAPDVMDKPSGAQLVVPDPTALTTFDSEKIQTISTNGAIRVWPTRNGAMPYRSCCR